MPLKAVNESKSGVVHYRAFHQPSYHAKIDREILPLKILLVKRYSWKWYLVEIIAVAR